MQQDPGQDPNYGNYGRQHEPGDEPYGPSPEGSHEREGFGGAMQTSTMSAQDEKTWSILSHLSALLGFFFLMPLGPLVIWLVYKDRSPEVRFHALQALWYQLAWVAVWVVGSVLGALFTAITFGFGMILVAPLALVVWLAPMAHGIYAAYKVNQGVEYRYPFVADKVEGGRG